MTAQKFSDKRGFRYFGFLLRQNWPALVTNSIVLILINVVIFSMALSDLVAGHTYTYLNAYDRVGRLLIEYRGVNVVFASLLAVLWGCTTMPYLNSKVGVNFHHSLPLKREQHYLYEIGAKVLLFVLPMGVSSLLGYFTTAVIAGNLTTNIGGTFLSIFFFSTTYFVQFYAIMIFAASFTGTGFGRLLSAGMVVFMPSILLSCLYTICDYSARYSSFNWISDIAERILLPVRALRGVQNDSTYTNITWELIGAWLIAAAFFAFGLLIYRKRKSELSGTPVLSVIARGLMKYSTIFVAATLFAMAMQDFADGVVGIFVGGAIGALLAAMLMNTILTKSAKNMFAGVRGLVISFAAFCVIFTVVGFDLIGFDTYIPSPSSVRTVSVQLGGVEVELTDRDDVKRVAEIVHAYFQNGLEENNGYDAIGTVVKGKYYDNDNMTTEDALRLDLLNIADSMFSETFYVRVTLKTATGLRFEKRYHAPVNGSHAEILTIMANSEDFPDAYFGESATYVGNGWLEMPFDNNYDSYKLSETYARQLWHDMRVSYNGIQYFNRPVMATVALDGTPMYRYPYYAETEEAIAQYMKGLTSVYVVNMKTGEMEEYTDSLTMESILRVGVLNETGARYFVPKDDTYVFFGIIGDKRNYSYISAYFLDGQIPAIPLP